MAETQHGQSMTAPPVTGLIRPRLIHAIPESSHTALGLVVAPPGAGKTTLLAHWAGQEHGRVVWYRARNQDAKPGRMLEAFAAALATAAGEERPCPVSELAAAAHRLANPLCFVVDDLHILTHTPAESELEQLLSLGSPRVRFLVASRRPPSFNLARSELASLVTVDAEDLRFRAREVEQLFRIVYKQPLSGPAAFNLARRTDGWAAALHFFHVATKSRSSVERRRLAESVSTVSRYTRDYLEQQFLADLPRDMDKLLRHTCHLEQLTPSRCDALISIPSSRGLLHELELRGIVSSDDGGSTYRVLEVLRQHLVSSMGEASHGPPEDIRQRTATVLEDEGAYADALRVLAGGGDWRCVRAMMERAGRAALRPGGCSWIALAPESLVHQDAYFALASARQLLDDGQTAAAATAAWQVSRLTNDAVCLAAAEDLRLAAAVWEGERPETGTGTGALLRTAIWQRPGTVARSLHHQSWLQDSLVSGLSLLVAGDQRGALPFLRRCAERPEEELETLCAQLALAVLGPESSRPGTEGQVEEIDAVQRQALRLGFTWLARIAQGIQAAHFGKAGSQEGVQWVIEDCESRGDEWGAAIVAAAVGLVRLQAGRPDSSAFEALAARFRRLHAGALESWALSAHALVAAAQDLPEAIDEAIAAEAFARTADVPGALAVAYAAMAQLKQEHHEDLMRMATETAKAAGLVCRPWTWLAVGSPRPSMLPDPNQSSHPVPTGPLTSVPVAGPLPALDVRCFGGFSIRADGVDVNLSKVRPQARTVLRILVLHAGRPVHRDRLAGALWADLDTPSALHNLQVSVSSLRRALQPLGLSESHNLIVRRGEAYALALGSRSRLDLLEFDQALHYASLARLDGDDQRAAVELRRAVELYIGDILPEDGTADWVTDTRERYRLQAAEAAATLASLEFALGNGTAAAGAAGRSLEIDPWRDASWRTLIGIYRRSGDRAAAEQTERRYRRMLSSLGVPSGDEAPSEDVGVKAGRKTELPPP